MSNILNLKPIDDKDSRREIRLALEKLTPFDRVAFLHWAKDQTNAGTKLRHNPPWTLVKITGSDGSVDSVAGDLCLMVATYGLNLAVVLRELERRAGEAKKLWVPAG